MNTYSTDVANGRAEAHELREGRLARKIEARTARLPSDLFLWAAGASILGSLVIEGLGYRRRPYRSFFTRRMERAPLASFIGMWAPTLLLLGVYNKIVKVAGSDRSTAMP